MEVFNNTINFYYYYDYYYYYYDYDYDYYYYQYFYNNYYDYLILDIGTEVNPKHFLPQCINVTCPWGNSFKLYQKNPARNFPPRGGLGILYIHLSVKKNTSKSIAQFYSEFFFAKTYFESETLVF